MADPKPLLAVSWIVAAFDGARPRFLCRSRQGHWVVTTDLDKAQPFEPADAYLAMADFRRQSEGHLHAAAGDWRVYQATTRTTFMEPSAED
jgi:hypothetical protein